jgi:hypothetical protein
MKYWKALLGLLVLSAAGFAFVSMRQNEGKLPWESQIARVIPQLKEAQLPAGTPVELILLEGIDAGGTKEGETVEMGVLKDVKVDGRIVIPMGARATAKVTKSRGASLLGAVANRPARLEITLESITLGSGLIVPIEIEKGDAIHEFTQENTAERIDAAKVENLWNDSGARDSMIKIAEGTIKGQPLERQHEEVKQLADRLGLEKTKELTTNPTKELTMERILAALAENNAADIGGIDSILLAQAAGEVSDLVSSVDHKVRGIFKGRTIRANIGTPVLVRTVKAQTFPAITKEKTK